MDREIDAGTRRKELAARVVKWLLLLAALAAGILLVGSWLEPSIDRTEIRTATVERGTIRAGFEASGEIAPAFERAISTPVDARVVDVLRQPGDILEPGEEILRLDTSASRLGLERITEQIEQKRQERERLAVRTESDLADLRSRIERTELDLELLESRADQNRKLHEEGLVSLETRRQAEVEAKKGRIELEDLHRSVASTAINRRSELATIDSAIVALGLEREQAARELELAMTRAPERGVLTWVTPQEGITVREGEVIARFADLSSFHVQATVSDIHAGRLSPGLPALVHVGDRWLDGRVSTVDPTIENGIIRFHVALEEPSDEMLRNKLRVDVQVVTEERRDVKTLDRGPHLSDARSQQVFVLRGDHAVRVEVTFGLVSPRMIEVLDGLNEGDEVIVSDMRDRLSLERIGID
ncbi:MAG: HlyD family efflux transporter periplasmic adaptor subunit [Acidobacteria bacterium]|nr:HlyD family efflux transporter periplasmic adaptor subunit [Acidobacteriota bacterium]